MGKRGPRKTPTTVLKLRGSWRAKQRRGEPAPEVAVPECPEWLDAIGQAEWERIVPELVADGLLAKRDLAALAGYCASYAEMVRCEQQRAELDGDYFETEFGPRMHPVVKQLHEARRLVRQFLAEFGLSPATRAGVQAEKQTKNALQDFAAKRTW